MATPNRWAVREAAEVTFFSLVSPYEALVTLKTLKLTDVETSGETVYARGGRGNAKLVGFSSNREAKVTIQDAIFDNAALALLTGNGAVAGAKLVNRYFNATIPAGLTVTVPDTIAAASNVISVHLVNADGSLKTKLAEDAAATIDTEYSRAGSVFTFATGQDGAGKNLVRIYYTATTDATATTVKVTSDKFGGTYRMVADVLIRDELTKKDYYGQFIAKNVKIEDNFKFNFSADGDPSVLDIPIEILKDPNSTDMWELVIYDDTLVV